MNNVKSEGIVELSLDDVEQVSGGNYWAAILLVADGVIDFCKGFKEGFDAGQKAQ